MGKTMKHIKNFMQKFIKNNILFHSAQNAFYFVLSIFPFIFILTKIFIHFPLPSDELLKSLEIIFPPEALKMLYNNLSSISKTPPTLHSTPYILVALWSSSMLIYSLKSIFALFYDKKSTKSRLIIRLLSIVTTTIILIAIIITFIAIFFVNFALNIIVRYFSVDYSPVLISVISIILIVFDIILLYIILPPERVKISQALPGAVISIIALTVSSYGFSYYVSYIADYSRLYGAMGGVIILLLWLYICSVIILSGGLINAEIKKDTR